MVVLTAFDMLFLKAIGTLLIILAVFMGAFFPSEDYEPKYRFLGILIPGSMFLIGLYLWSV